MAVRFELRTDLDAAGLAPLWQALELRADAGVFRSWHWIGCWLAETGIQPVVLVGHVDGQVVLLGVLAPGERRQVLGSISGLRLHTTGDEAQDVITIEYNGFLTDRAWAGAADAAALRYLLGGVVAAGRRRDELHLRNIAAAPGVAAPEELPDGVVMRELFRKPSWHVDLAALRAAGTPYLDSLSANTRQQLRRAVRRYERRGKLTITRARDVPEALAWLAELKRLHQHYWTGKGSPGAFAYPFFEGFQHRLISASAEAGSLAAGAVELVRVCCGAQPIGYLYNLVGDGRVLSYQSGIAYDGDPRLKPGLVCHLLCIELHLREGAVIYDFMAGAARYKASLGIPGPDMVYRVLERPTPGYGWNARCAALVRRFV